MGSQSLDVFVCMVTYELLLPKTAIHILLYMGKFWWGKILAIGLLQTNLRVTYWQMSEV